MAMTTRWKLESVQILCLTAQVLLPLPPHPDMAARVN